MDAMSWVADAAVQRAEWVRAGRLSKSRAALSLEILRFCERRDCMPAGGGGFGRDGYPIGNRGLFVAGDGRWWVFADRVTAPLGRKFAGVQQVLVAAISGGSREVDRIGKQWMVSNRFMKTLGPQSIEWTSTFAAETLRTFSGRA